jgi:hypothetical protein
MKKFMPFLVVLCLTACSTPTLKEGASVSTNSSEVTKECRQIGLVSGESGGAFGGTIGKSELQQYALNDLKNRAAQQGATHVVLSGGDLSGGLWSPTSGMMNGLAYKCP